MASHVTKVLALGFLSYILPLYCPIVNFWVPQDSNRPSWCTLSVDPLPATLSVYSHFLINKINSFHQKSVHKVSKSRPLCHELFLNRVHCDCRWTVQMTTDSLSLYLDYRLKDFDCNSLVITWAVTRPSQSPIYVCQPWTLLPSVIISISPLIILHVTWLCFYWVKCEDWHCSHACTLNMKLPLSLAQWLETACLALSKGNKISRPAPLKLIN